MANYRYIKSDAIKLLEQFSYDYKRAKYPNMPEHCFVRPKYRDDSTNQLTKCIIDFIELNGGQAERINSMGRCVDNRKTVVDCLGHARTIGSYKWVKPNTTIGTADISTTIQGRAVKVEVKCLATGDRYQSDAQKAYQKAIEQAGGLYVIARDFQSFYEWYLITFCNGR